MSPVPQGEGTDAVSSNEVDEYIRRTAYRHYEMTVAMLNKTMGLCLR